MNVSTFTFLLLFPRRLVHYFVRELRSCAKEAVGTSATFLYLCKLFSREIRRINWKIVNLPEIIRAKAELGPDSPADRRHVIDITASQRIATFPHLSLSTQ